MLKLIFKGISTNIFIEKEETSQFPYPYSQCKLTNFESLPYERYKSHLKSLNLEYRALDCYAYCYWDLIETCPMNLTERNCASSDSFNKLYDSYCTSNCPQMCNVTKYNTKMSYLTFPTRSYFEKNNFFNKLNASKDYNTLK